MDKNFIAAVVLSLLVLLGYDALVVAPKRAHMKQETKVVQNTEVATNSPNSSSPAVVNASNTTVPTITGKSSPIKSTIFNANVNNVGGSLHSVKILPEEHILPVIYAFNTPLDSQRAFQIQNLDKGVQLTSTEAGVTIRKTIEYVDNHVMTVRMEIKNNSEISILMPSINALNLDTTILENATNNRETMLDEYSYNANGKIFRKNGAAKFGDKDNHTVSGPIKWFGFRDHFYTTVIKPEFETKGIETKTLSEKSLSINIVPAVSQINPKETMVYEFSVYAGLQDIEVLKSYKKGWEGIVAFSNFLFGISGWISIAVYYTLPVLHNIFFHSWGIALIMISVLIYGLTYPLTMKSMMSMRKMQQAQPKIAALKEKYKNDPQRLNMEMVEIYRREKINPFGGCIPFILQMPIFIAIYQVLWRNVHFKGQSFLWIKDLTMPDRLIMLPFNLPFIGNEFNILPILMGIVMFFQQKLSAKNMVATDETQIMQQKMMTMFFPIFIAFIFYHFASSLSLYFTLFYLFSTLTQWRLSKIK